jgi:hypothetical protein
MPLLLQHPGQTEDHDIEETSNGKANKPDEQQKGPAVLMQILKENHDELFICP